MPFTLDQPPPPATGRTSRDQPAAPATASAGPDQPAAPATGSPADQAATGRAIPDQRPAPSAADREVTEGRPGPAAPRGEATPSLSAPGGEATPGPSAPGGEATPGLSIPGGEATPGPSTPGGEAAPRPVGSAAVSDVAGGEERSGDGDRSGGAGRPGESPWAYPPQRPATTGPDRAEAQTATGTPGPDATSRPAGTSPPPQVGNPNTVGTATMPGAGNPHAVGTATTPGAGNPHAVGTATAPDGGSPGVTAVPPPPLGDRAAVGAPPWPGVAEQQPPPPPSTAQPGDPVPPAPQVGATPPPGPYPPSPGWYPPPWQQGAAGTPQAQPAQPEQPAQAPGYTDANWTPETTAAPTAEDFARRRQVRPADPVATMGVRAVANKIGLRLAPGRHEQELKRDIEMVRRNFGGLRQVTVVNPKGGAGKTVAILLLAMTFGQKRGGYVLAWDNNETQGTLGMRAQQDFHSRTVRDMLRDLGQFQGAHGRVGDLSQYVRSQGEGMFDVLASDESATGGEMLTAAAFAEIREVVSRFYKLIFVDTGNNVRAQNWQAAMDATDQLVVTMSARNDSAETAARMLDHLEQSGRQRLVRQAVTVVSMPPSRKEIDLPAIQEHFAARTRAVLLAPYERLIDSGEPIRYGALSSATRDAWLKIAAAVAEGL
ncbi:chromosome partitioning protein [Micromonospora sp. NPDC051006]|uniref:chromosome partitioning protein n=1 Tax=Micromonospora sp. NPDC051006 TaxID=3364283 RepID=UPI0037B1699A